MLVENMMLALLGGLAGLLVAYGTLQVLLALAPQRLPRLDEIALDARSMGFGLLVTLVAAVLFSLAPILRAARVRLSTSLRGSRGTSAGRGQHRSSWGR
jgi:putative ABC transport system permease protein